MLLSDLDGFLTGIAIGPAVVMPSEWLPHVWGGDEPVFDDHLQASAILGTIMGRYNMILRDTAAGAFGPLFWETQDGTVIAADWAEGFMQAVALRADAWEPLMRSRRHGRLLLPILALCADEHGDSALGLDPEEEDRVIAEAAEFIPVCVPEIARLSGISCLGGHDGWKGAQRCPDAKSLISLMPSWTSFWLERIPRRPSIRTDFSTA